MYKLGIRYYDPTLGRFTQPDPTGQDPHYTYARNSPCNFVDSTGAGSTTVIGNCGGLSVAAFESAAGNIRYDVQVAQNRRATSYLAKVAVVGGATDYRGGSLFFRSRFRFGGNLPSPGGTNLLVITLISQPYGCTGQAIVDTKF